MPSLQALSYENVCILPEHPSFFHVPFYASWPHVLVFARPDLTHLCSRSCQHAFEAIFHFPFLGFVSLLRCYHFHSVDRFALPRNLSSSALWLVSTCQISYLHSIFLADIIQVRSEARSFPGQKPASNQSLSIVDHLWLVNCWWSLTRAFQQHLWASHTPTYINSAPQPSVKTTSTWYSFWMFRTLGPSPPTFTSNLLCSVSTQQRVTMITLSHPY